MPSHRRNPDRLPKLTHHKASGQGVVRLNGRDHYCGRYGTAECQAEWLRIVSDWLANRRQDPNQDQDPPHGDITINELMMGFLAWAEGYYRKNGKPTGETTIIRYAIRPLRTVRRHGGGGVRPVRPEGGPPGDGRCRAVPQRVQPPDSDHRPGVQVGGGRGTGPADGPPCPGGGPGHPQGADHRPGIRACPARPGCRGGGDPAPRGRHPGDDRAATGRGDAARRGLPHPDLRRQYDWNAVVVQAGRSQDGSPRAGAAHPAGSRRTRDPDALASPRRARAFPVPSLRCRGGAAGGDAGTTHEPRPAESAGQAARANARNRRARPTTPTVSAMPSSTPSGGRTGRGRRRDCPPSSHSPPIRSATWRRTASARRPMQTLPGPFWGIGQSEPPRFT